MEQKIGGDLENHLGPKEKLWHNKWRPAIGWSYMVICLFDFMLAPILLNIMQLFITGDINIPAQWEPRTLQAGGLYHLSMLTIVGVTAYGRTKEKIENLEFEVQAKKDKPELLME